MKIENRKGLKTILSCVIAFLGVYALPDMMGFTKEQLYLTNSVYMVMGWISLAFVIYKGADRVDWSNFRENVLAILFAVLFSTCMAIGSDLDSKEYLTFGNWKRIGSIVCSSITLTVTLREIWSYLGEYSPKTSLEDNEKGYSHRMFILIALLFILSWFPVFLATYPGFFVYDAQDELNEVLTRSFTTHHPLLHVLMLGGVITAVHKVTGSYNLGIACYVMIQMFMAAGTFAYMLSFLKKHHVRKEFRIITFLFIAFFPVIPMYVLCSTKDTVFTLALLLLLMSMYEMLTNETSFFMSWKQPFIFSISLFLMVNLRHNGMYALLVLVPFLVWNIVSNKRKCLKKIIALFAITLVFSSAFSTMLSAVLHADTGEHQEMLTVPIMQLTRVYVTDKDYFSMQEREILYSYLPENAMDKYTPKLSDSVKVQFNNERYSEDALTFWKLWLKTGLSHVGTYINAWLYTSYGFWYPDTIIDVYSGIQRYTFTYEESSYFGYETELPGNRESKIPWLDSFYRKVSLEIAQQKIPVISMLFSPGFLFWIYAFTYIIFWKQKRTNRMLTYGLIILLWLTVLLGPTYMVRYVLIFWFALPVLLVMLFEKQTGFA